MLLQRQRPEFPTARLSSEVKLGRFCAAAGELSLNFSQVGGEAGLRSDGAGRMGCAVQDKKAGRFRDKGLRAVKELR